MVVCGDLVTRGSAERKKDGGTAERKREKM